MRAVADTNTVVSALLWGGAPADILIAARQQRLALFTSAVLIAELEEVLVRDKFAERISRVGMTVADLLSGYRALAQFVRPAAMAPISRDPDDDHVLACAFAADAKLVVTRDKDLLVLDPLRDIRILSAREALAILA